MLYRSYDLAALDGQYDNRARVPDFADILARWRQDSERARDELICQLDVPYGEAAGETLDLFFPPEHNRPVLMFIHGGYWRLLDKADFSFVARPFVEAGYGVAVVNYALAPHVRVSEIVAQMRRATLWLWRNGTDLGFDSARILACGHSAGGHLAAELLATKWTEIDAIPRNLVSGALSISGLYDLEPLRLSSMNSDLRLDEAEAHALSPIYRPPDNAGPMVACVGADESEEFHRQQADFVDAWAQRSVTVKTVAAIGRNHFTVLDALVEPRHPLFQCAIEML